MKWIDKGLTFSFEERVEGEVTDKLLELESSMTFRFDAFPLLKDLRPKTCCSELDDLVILFQENMVRTVVRENCWLGD